MRDLYPITIDESKSSDHVSTAATVAGSNKSGFVKAMDHRARSYLETIKRSFSSSSVARYEDPTCMTIDFLRAQLQAQRAKYKAEKLRSWQLARKVQELEQKLIFGNELTEKMECEGSIVPGDENSSWELQHLTSEELGQEISSISLQSNETASDSTKDEDRNSDVHSEISIFDGQCTKCSLLHCCYRFNCQRLRLDCQLYYSQEKSNESDTFRSNEKLLARSSSEEIRKKSRNLVMNM